MGKAKVFKGEWDGRIGYGVEQDNCVVYEAVFANKKVATRIAAMENRKDPPVDWMETRELLLKEGFKEDDL
jgi:hypothetical protein